MWAILEISMEEGKYVSHFFVVDLYKGNKCYNLFVVLRQFQVRLFLGNVGLKVLPMNI